MLIVILKCRFRNMKLEIRHSQTTQASKSSSNMQQINKNEKVCFEGTLVATLVNFKRSS
jgi:hypothetical protein